MTVWCTKHLLSDTPTFYNFFSHRVFHGSINSLKLLYIVYLHKLSAHKLEYFSSLLISLSSPNPNWKKRKIVSMDSGKKKKLDILSCNVDF